MIPKKIDLCKSITLYTVKTDKFKTGMLSLSLAMQREAHTSVYNNIISGVMRRGTQKYPSISLINRRLDELYASTIEIKTQKYGDNELFVLSSELLDNRFSTDGTDIIDGVLELMSELLLRPLYDKDGMFDEKRTEQEKRIVADALRAEINNPRGYALIKLFESLNRNNKKRAKYADLLEIVESADRKALTEHYKNNILCKHIDIFYVGALDEEELVKKIFAYFGDLCTDSENNILPLYCENADSAPIILCEDMPVSQGKLAMGFRTGVCIDSQQYYATVVLNEILGGSPASKLFMNVREKMSLCYYCSSSYNMYTGNLIISSGIEVDDYERANLAILSEIDDIKNGKITCAEFDAARKSLDNGYRQIYDNPFEINNFYLGRSLLGISDTIDGCREKLLSVTLDEVIEAAQNITLDTVFFLRGTLNSDTEEYDDE